MLLVSQSEASVLQARVSPHLAQTAEAVDQFHNGRDKQLNCEAADGWSQDLFLINVKQGRILTASGEESAAAIRRHPEVEHSKLINANTTVETKLRHGVFATVMLEAFSSSAHLFFSLGHPGLNQQLQSGPVVLSGGLHCNKYVLQLQLVAGS